MRNFQGTTTYNDLVLIEALEFSFCSGEALMKKSLRIFGVLRGIDIGTALVAESFACKRDGQEGVDTSNP